MERLRRHPGGVRGRKGDVGEKWLSGFAGAADELAGSFGELGKDVFHLEAGGNGAAAPIGAAFDFAVVGDGGSWLLQAAVVLDEDIGRHVE